MLLIFCPIISNADENIIKVVLNGQQMEFDVSHTIIQDRVMLPVRKIFEALGATVNWDGATQTITGVKGDTTIIMQIDSTDATINGIHEKCL